jgi:large subunit ribosomal protein L6
MSKIGKKEIEILDGVKVTVEKHVVTAVGPKGTLSCDTEGRVKVVVSDKTIVVESKDTRNTSFQGLYRTLINNAIVGVKNGASKKLEFNGIGYKAAVVGENLVLNVGYSHPVTINKVDGIEYEVKDNTITVSGINKVLVGDMAAKIRAVRKPEPYKGKGIKYAGEVIIRKETKAA